MWSKNKTLKSTEAERELPQKEPFRISLIWNGHPWFPSPASDEIPEDCEIIVDYGPWAHSENCGRITQGLCYFPHL